MNGKLKRWRWIWNVVVAIATTVSVVMIPLVLVSGFPVEARLHNIEWVGFVVFGLDAMLRWQEARTLRQRVLWVLYDVLPALPFYSMLGPTVLLSLRLLKLVRVGQLLQRVRRQYIRQGNLLRLAFFAYGLSLCIHWASCGWAALKGPYADPLTRYVDAVYWCIATLTTVGYGDVIPANLVEKVYATFVMLLGVGVYAYLIGNIATILSNIDPARAAHLQQTERLAAFLQYRNVPRPIQQRVRDYLDYVWTQRRGFDEALALGTLPPHLRDEVNLALKRDLLEQFPLFRGTEEAFIRDVALQLKAVVYLPGDTIVLAGSRAENMFFLTRGAAEVLAPSGEETYATLEPGDFFGEVALFFAQPRTATVRAIEYCDLYCLDKATFEYILANYPDVAAKMRVRAQERYESADATIGDGA